MSESSEGSVSMESSQISDAFQKILENPEIINTVAAAIGMPMPSKSTGNEQNTPASETPKSDVSTAISPLLSSISKKDASPNISSNQACLLRALKPYVNSNRCEAIDYIIKITEISQLLKKIN